MSHWKRVKQFLVPPKLPSIHPDLRGSFNSIDGSTEEEVRRYNEVEVSIANFELTKVALQKNLNIAYWALITSLLAVIVAIVAVLRK